MNQLMSVLNVRNMMLICDPVPAQFIFFLCVVFFSVNTNEKKRKQILIVNRAQERVHAPLLCLHSPNDAGDLLVRRHVRGDCKRHRVLKVRVL